MIESIISLATDGEPLALLAAETGLSKSKIKDAMTKGAVWLKRGRSARRLRRATATAAAGDKISIFYDPAILGYEVPAPQLIADEDLFSVWYKPPGVLSSGSRFGDHTAINRIVERQWQRPVFLVHRLDQFASGLMVLAHGKQVAADLSAQFQARSVTKVYRAVVAGKLTEPRTITEPLDGREAVSHARPLATGDDMTLVEIRIETGRKHQIRRHLAGIGHAVIGDRQYGGEPDDHPLTLVACELRFKAPDSRSMAYELPSGFQPSLPGTTIGQ